MDQQKVATPFGNMLAVWSVEGLLRFEFDRGSDMESVGNATQENQGELLEGLESYLDSGVFPFDLNRLDWADTTDFQREVLEACYEIPSGQTKTYGDLAKAVSRPKAARAVGGVMASNRWPLLIPCHRVVGALGQMTGYSGEGGIEKKRMLLEFERSKLSEVKGQKNFAFAEAVTEECAG